MEMKLYKTKLYRFKPLVVSNVKSNVKKKKNKFAISDCMFYSVKILTRLKQLSLLFGTLKIQ